MARKTTVLLQDDLDGTAATHTLRFGFQGVNYEIDLNDENAAEMTHWLENYISHGRCIGGRKSSPSTSGFGVDAKAIRAWANQHGYQLSSRGRIPAYVVAAYNAG